ncbi:MULTISPECIES: cytochrome bd-I oxidase subunit CydH [Vibrio]|nr:MULTISPECIES: YnhF family membrane protein [Vibrio]MPW35356.1 YnhF family membrane protein [Vibrio sp. B1Z05]
MNTELKFTLVVVVTSLALLLAYGLVAIFS